MIRVTSEGRVFRGVEAHLRKPEQVGFFLAAFESEKDTFHLRAWHPVLDDGYELQTPVHVALKDELRGEMIQWAWQEQLCLVEIHSHGGSHEAEFSPSDRYGFEEWVPHVWWRLQARPYAALVVAGHTFDGWAWIDDARSPVQVSELAIGGEARAATRSTFRNLELRRKKARLGA